MTADENQSTGRWVNRKTFSELTQIPMQTLANWRSRDIKAGRTEAPSGFPRYRVWGEKLIRYWVPEAD